MKNLFEHKVAAFLVICTLLAAVVIGVFGALSERGVTAAETVVAAAAEPGQQAASGAGGWLRNFFGYFGSVKALREENERLKAENIELDKQVRDAQGLEEENRELRDMLNLTETEKKLKLTAAQVIAKDPSNWYSSFTIEKGSRDGIQKDQPVITAKKELIGCVYKVGPNWAEVITILDPESGVGSMIERSGDLGILSGDTALRYQGQCRLGYLSRDTDIEAGDYVETSGMGGIYPKGLLIGKVLEIAEDNATMSRYATVEPVVDIARQRQVFVLTNVVEEVVRTDDTAARKKDASANRNGTAEDEDEDAYTDEDEDEDSRGSGSSARPSASARPSGSRSDYQDDDEESSLEDSDYDQDGEEEDSRGRSARDSDEWETEE